MTNDQVFQQQLHHVQKKVMVLFILIFALLIQAIYHITESNKIQQAQGFQLVNNNKQIMAGLEMQNGAPNFLSHG